MDHALADSIDEQLWFGEDDPAHADRAAAESLAAAVARIAGLKPLPVVAQKVLVTLSSDDWDARQVAQMLQADPSMASMVLRLANSSFYRRGAPARSVQQAVGRLGGSKLRELVVGVASMRLVSGDDARARRWRDHCAGTAAVARHLAVVAGLDGSTAFLAGLLHDMGKLLMLETEEVDYDTIDEASAVSDEGLPAAERWEVDFDHAVLGGHVLREWGIPDPVPQLVAWHHQPGRAYGDIRLAPQLAVLRLADRLVEGLDAGAAVDAEVLGSSSEASVLGWSPEAVEAMLGDLAEARQEALAVFG